MHMGGSIPALLLCLIQLGLLKLSVGFIIKSWKEETENRLKDFVKFSHSLRPETSLRLAREPNEFIGSYFNIGERSISTEVTNYTDKARNELKSWEVIKINSSETSKRRSDVPDSDKKLGKNDEELLLSSSQRQVDANVDLGSVPDCPAIHQSCERPRRVATGLQCSCHDECRQYGDCCFDYPYNVTSRESDRNEECINFKGTSDSNSYFMVSSCPNNWINQNTKHLCENLKTFEDDPICHVPVTSNVTNRTYRNLFCAVCNGESDIVAWKIPNVCRENTNPFDFLIHCRKDFKPPSHEKTPRICHWGIVMSCSDKFASDDIKRKCSYYYQPFKYVNENGTVFIYKNVFCAICNGVHEQLSCPFPTAQAAPAYTPLAVLLDVDFREGGTAVGKMTRCEPDYVFDPWMEECRSVFCGRLYELKNGKCVKSLVSKETAQYLLHSSILDSDCLKVSVNSSGYSIQDNGTVVLQANGDNLHPGEYETAHNNSILICTSESDNYMDKFSDAQNYLTIACVSLSMCCLLVKTILFFAIPEPRKVPNVVVIFLSISLFIAQFLFLAGSNQSETALCVCIGVSLHFFILASVFWTNVLAFDIWKTFSTIQKHISDRYNNNLIYYTAYSWGSPVLIVFVGSVVEWVLPRSKYSPQYGYHVCWISNRMALLLFFAAPLGVILIVNIIFFSMTAFIIAKTSKLSKIARQSTGENNHIKFALYVKLALVMGLTWIFGFVSAYTNNSVMWYLFTIFNGIQGAYILLAFSHFKKLSLKNSRDRKSTGSGTKSSLTNSANSSRTKE